MQFFRVTSIFQDTTTQEQTPKPCLLCYGSYAKQQYPSVAHILIHSVNLTFGASGLIRASKINVGFGLGSVSCFKMRPIYCIGHTQTHTTSNGYFKLAEALLHIQSGFFSHSIKLRGVPLSAVTVSLHYLPRYLRSTPACGKTPVIVNS